MGNKRTRNNKLIIGIGLNSLCIIFRDYIPNTIGIITEIIAIVLLIWAMLEIRRKHCE